VDAPICVAGFIVGICSFEIIDGEVIITKAIITNPNLSIALLGQSPKHLAKIKRNPNASK